METKQKRENKKIKKEAKLKVRDLKPRRMPKGGADEYDPTQASKIRIQP